MKTAHTENLFGNLRTVPDGWLAVPPELEQEAKGYLPYIKLTIKKGAITAVAQGERPQADIEPLRTAKLAEISTAFAAIEQGAAGYPYHADGQLCRLYPAADIVAIGMAVTAHKLYHTTYCNHLMVWARRAETEEELEAIFYGAELPADLAANLGEVL